ncbi:carboxypeptidase A6-like [Sinocyclocheilus grahami]|uniref:carboxypeptidase A6-like n=1 Tax=Sinocyclocheilus grahami TaxID=75366 RepID=UPI0007AC9677|nr:PREDICTED: carboxypeptidase A6-like [Sinocyclocheilus grahami]
MAFPDLSSSVLLGCVIIFSTVLYPVDSYFYNNRYFGDQVLRIIPSSNTEVQAVKQLFQNLTVDLWKPNSAYMIQENSQVDVHVGRNKTQWLRRRLRQAHIHYEVLISNLQTEIEKQIGHQTSRKRRSEFQYDYEVYHPLEDIQSWMFEMNRTHPHLVELFSIGQSYEGRPLYVLQLGKRTRPFKKAVWIDCGVHAREWIGPAFCQWFVKEIQSWMFEMNRTHPHLVELFSIGQSYEGRPLYVLQLGKRTRPFKKAVWIDCGVHAREWIGPAFCQWFVKEESAAQNAVSALYSAYGVRYRYGPASTTLYMSSGSSIDWAYKNGIPYAFAFELRDTGYFGFLLPEALINPTCTETMRAVKTIASGLLKKCTK